MKLSVSESRRLAWRVEGVCEHLGYARKDVDAFLRAADDADIVNMDDLPTLTERLRVFRPYLTNGELPPLFRVLLTRWDFDATPEKLGECAELLRDGMPDELVASLVGVDLREVNGYAEGGDLF